MKKTMKALAAIMLMMAALFVAGCKSEDGPNNGGGGNNNSESGTYNGHAYVDLGLPSGTLWATCNVGADNPEDYGDYFAWGETNSKTNYDWDNYKHCYMGDYYQLTKYCHNSNYGYNGFTDTLSILLPEDDASTVNWGGGWCMPTAEQGQELYQNTTHSWTTQNGVKGRRFTASNGNSLFLPAAGRRWVDVFEDAGIDGQYWLSSLSDDDHDQGDAWCLLFNSGQYKALYDRRYRGYTVRPVYNVP